MMKAKRKSRNRQSSGSRQNKSQRRRDHNSRIEAVQLFFEFMDHKREKARVAS
jgi:hypothetical protein